MAEAKKDPKKQRRSPKHPRPARTAEPAKIKRCFVVEPIGEERSPTRKHSDMVFHAVISPPVTEAGYQLLRPLDLKDPGVMTDDIFRQIVEGDLVIANLSGHNPNVFYEVAVRHVTRRPIIHLIRKGESIPFDIHHMRAIFVDVEDWESVKRAGDEIAAQIKTIESNPRELRSPLSMFVDLQLLSQSRSPENQMIAELVKEMADRTKALANLEFDEKMAVMAHYKHKALHEGLFETIEMVRNDFRAVTHLKDWVDRGMRERLIRDYILTIVEAAEEDIRLMDNTDKRGALKEIICIALGYNIEIERLSEFDQLC